MTREESERRLKEFDEQRDAFIVSVFDSHGMAALPNTYTVGRALSKAGRLGERELTEEQKAAAARLFREFVGEKRQQPTGNPV